MARTSCVSSAILVTFPLFASLASSPSILRNDVSQGQLQSHCASADDSFPVMSIDFSFDVSPIKLDPAERAEQLALDNVPAIVSTTTTSGPALSGIRTAIHGQGLTSRTPPNSMGSFTTVDPDTTRPVKKRRGTRDPIATQCIMCLTRQRCCTAHVTCNDCCPDVGCVAVRSESRSPSLSESTSNQPPLQASASPTTTPGLSSGAEPPVYEYSMTGYSPSPSPAQGTPSRSSLLQAESQLIAKIRPEMARLFQETEHHKAHNQPILYDSYKRLHQTLDNLDLFAHFETDPHPSTADQAFPNGEFKSLLISKEDLQAATLDGGSVHVRYAVIKIPGATQDESDLRLDFDSFRRRVGYAYSKSNFQYQNYEGQSIGSISGDSLFKILNNEASSSTQAEVPPKNFLSLSGFTLNDSSEPPALRQLGYDLLKDLLMRTRSKLQEIDGSSDPAGKEQLKVYYLSDLEACLSFLLYGQRGSLSLWHMDILNGTWVRCVSGMKLWFVYTGPFDEATKEAFANKGIHWIPPKGTVKCYVLKPGDTLIMRPGYPIVHAVITLEDSLMIGGMMWPRSGIAPVMRNLQYIMKNYRSTNEDIARQLPTFLNELQLLMCENTSPRDYTFTAEDVDAVDDLIKTLHPTFSCAGKCKGGCKTNCPCKVKREDKNQGCSVWCHSDFALNPDDGCNGPPVCKCAGPCRACVCAKLSIPCGDLCHKCSCGNKPKGLECTEDCVRHTLHEKCKNKSKKLEKGGVGVKVGL